MEITRTARRGKNFEGNFPSMSPRVAPENRALTLFPGRCQSRER
jgi:hypothetical protein